uniref:Uncharacterized protein n=1 Tax=Anguilla anguilla TaxID=7936 RepID=A0A0E9QNJ0_ANGAN
MFFSCLGKNTAMPYLAALIPH